MSNELHGRSLMYATIDLEARFSFSKIEKSNFYVREYVTIGLDCIINCQTSAQAQNAYTKLSTFIDADT